MKEQTRNMSSHRVQVLVLAVAVAIAAMIGAMTLATSDCWAGTVYEDNNAKATVNDNGESGKIELKNRSITSLSEIDGTPLKDIVKFCNGGYVSKFTFSYVQTYWWLPNHMTFEAYGAGPKGVFEGAGLVLFNDGFDDYYLNIFNSSPSSHVVRDYYYDNEVRNPAYITWENAPLVNF